MLASALTFSRGSRLSEGALVEARLRGRVLGVPLLKIDALVAIVPANPTSAPSTPRAPLPERTVTSGNRSRRLETPGSALAEAVRSIDQAAELLAEARNGSRLRGPPAASVASPTRAWGRANDRYAWALRSCVRSDPALFIVARGHIAPDVEGVTADGGAYQSHRRP